MGLIKEPLDVDFVVESRPLTKTEEKAISEYIRKDKEHRKRKTMAKHLRPKVKSKV